MFQFPMQQEPSSLKKEKSSDDSTKACSRGSVQAHGIPTASTELRVDLAVHKMEGVDLLVAVDGRNDLWVSVDGLAISHCIEYYNLLDFADGIWIDVIYRGDSFRMMKASDCVRAVAVLAEKQLVTPKLIELQFLNVPNTTTSPDTSGR